MRDRKTYTSAVIAFLTEQLRLNVSVTPPLADDTTTGDRFQLRLTSTLTGSAAANLSLPSSLAVLGGGQHFEADRTGHRGIGEARACAAHLISTRARVVVVRVMAVFVRVCHRTSPYRPER
jgi:hypothetical protein